MKGREIIHYPTDKLPVAGDYWKDSFGKYHGVTPNGLFTNLSNHHVVENTDGTITVSPSILVKLPTGDKEIVWHGYLENSIWREC